MGKEISSIQPAAGVPLAVVLGLFLFAWAEAHTPYRRVDHLFAIEDFDRSKDGYNITIANKSKRAFSDILIVVLGRDLSHVTVYRREIPVEFMEGKEVRTFFLSGYDERVFKFRIKVFDYGPLSAPSKNSGQ